MAGQVGKPQVRVVDVRQPLAERQALVSVEGKSEHPHHHAFGGLGRMAGEGQGMVRVVIAVHVGNLQPGFIDSRFQGHALF